MNKKLTSILLVVVMLVALCVPAMAAPTETIKATYENGVVTIKDDTLKGSYPMVVIYDEKVKDVVVSDIITGAADKTVEHTITTGALANPADCIVRIYGNDGSVIAFGKFDIPATAIDINGASVTFEPTSGTLTNGSAAFPTVTVKLADGTAVDLTKCTVKWTDKDNNEVTGSFSAAGTYTVTIIGNGVDYFNSTSATFTVSAGGTGGGTTGGGSVVGGGGGTTTTTGNVTLPADIANGTVKIDPANPKEGDTVTITATPKENYEIGSITVTDKDGNVITLTKNADGTYSFVMPKGTVKVDVKFQYRLTFDDLVAGEYYIDAIRWALEKGITTGKTATKFRPLEDCNRAMIVTFLWRANGSPEPKSLDNPFTDLDKNQYYYKAVLWAVENGITTGKTTTTFAPEASCTRGQAVTFIWRSLGRPASNAATFGDVVAGEYYEEAVSWAVEKNVTNGTSANKFSPETVCNRAMIVTFLYRALAK